MSSVATITINAEIFSNQLESSLKNIKKFAEDAKTNLNILNKSTSDMIEPLNKVNDTFVKMTGIDPLGPIIGGIETGVGHIKKLAEEANTNLSKAFTIPENITSAIDSKIREPIKNTISFADTLGESATEMLGPLKKVNDVFVGMTGVDALGPVIGGIETGIGYVQSFSDGMEKLNGLLDLQKIATDAQAVAQAALNFVMNMNPIALVVIAIAALVAGFILLWNNCEGFRNFFIAMWEGICQVLSAAWEWICGTFSGLGVWFSEQWNIVVELFAGVAEWFGGIFTAAWDWICSVFSGLGAWFSEQWNIVVELFAGVAEWFSGIFTAAWNCICGVFSGIGAWFSDRWNDIVAAFSVVTEWFGGIFSGAWENIKNAFSAVGSFFSGIWSTITGLFTSIGTTIGDAIGGAFKTVVNSIIGFAEKTINGFIKAINVAISAINCIPGVNIGKLTLLNIPRLADGGFISTGQMFIAREAGPELVGTIGSRNAVVNNNQIVESVSAGVYRAVRDAMKGNNPSGVQTIMVDKRVLGQVVAESLNGYSRSLGHVPLTT